MRERPTYILKSLPPALRRSISEEARAEDMSVADTVRRALSERYRFPFERSTRFGGKVPVRYEAGRDQGHPDILLRVEPALFGRIRAHSARFKTRKKSMRSLIVEALEEHYERRNGD